MAPQLDMEGGTAMSLHNILDALTETLKKTRTLKGRLIILQVVWSWWLVFLFFTVILTVTKKETDRLPAWWPDSIVLLLTVVVVAAFTVMIHKAGGWSLTTTFEYSIGGMIIVPFGALSAVMWGWSFDQIHTTPLVVLGALIVTLATISAMASAIFILPKEEWRSIAPRSRDPR